MTPDEGIERLIFHTKPEPGSFLNMLRPYKGLQDKVLADVARSLRACAHRFTGEVLPRELVSAVWALSHLGRAWALEPAGMLRQNRPISEADQAKLADFLSRIEYAVMMLLDGASAEAFANWPAGVKAVTGTPQSGGPQGGHS